MLLVDRGHIDSTDPGREGGEGGGGGWLPLSPATEIQTRMKYRDPISIYYLHFSQSCPPPPPPTPNLWIRSRLFWRHTYM